MNIVRKVVDIKLNNEEFKATFDMRSVIKFKELSGKSFLASVEGLKTMDEDVILYFMASTIRKTENSNPLGKELLENYDLMYLLLNYTELVLDLITSSMPQANGSNEKK